MDSTALSIPSGLSVRRRDYTFLSIVLPQLQDAGAEGDPQQRGLEMFRAELLRHFGTNLGCYARRLSKMAREARRRGREPLPDPELQMLLKLNDQLIRMMLRMNKPART